MEIERKFLLDAPPAAIEGRAGTRIAQGYVAITDDTEVRIRARGNDRVLTVKGGRGLVRHEVSVELSVDAFDDMWELTEGRRITKRRWVLDHGDAQIEIDVFDGDLDGLLIAEVEFETEQASAAFTPPDWFGREVTDDDRYRNAALAVDGAPDA